MSNQIFTDRVARIEAKHSKGFAPEMLAGVGDVNDAKKAAEDGLRRPSLLLALLGMLFGAANVGLLHDIVGIDRFATSSQAEMLALIQSDPMVTGLAAALVLCAVMGLWSLIRGRRALHFASFAWPTLIAAGATAWALS